MRYFFRKGLAGSSFCVRMLQRLQDNVRLAFSEGITVDDGDQSDQNNNCRHRSLSRETEREATPDDWDQLVRLKQKNKIHYQAVKTGERVSSGGAVQCHRWPEMNKTNWNQMEFCKQSMEGLTDLALLSHPAVAGLNPGTTIFSLFYSVKPRGELGIFFWFSFIFSHKQCLRPLGYCTPLLDDDPWSSGLSYCL